MTHFGVLARLPASITSTPDNISSWLTQLMEPWQEHSCTGKCPQQFMEFDDEEDAYVEEYATGTDHFIDIEPAAAGESGHAGRDSVLIYNGRRLVRSYNEMFRVPGSFGIGGGTHKVPEDLPEVEVPFKVLHSSLEDFAREYHGRKDRDPVKGRYGYWENPDKRWDYWSVIENRVPLCGEGASDWGRISQLDHAALTASAQERAEKTVKMLEMVRRGEQEMDDRNPSRPSPFWAMDARGVAIEYGVLRCLAPAEITSELRSSFRVVKQDRRDGLVYYDVWDDAISHDALMAAAIVRCHPLRLWATVEWSDDAKTLAHLTSMIGAADAAIAMRPPAGHAIRLGDTMVKGDSAWTQAGQMGWFACHDATPNKLAKHAAGIADWLKTGNQGDILVCLDCHI